ncbi:MAG: Cysteine desulfurase [Firmicutes bacterium ADurb.Bin080]|jgi:cysteine desulfurase|nr:cysteine desulfurase [Clostridiales bacterium]OQC12700.1 MAG: Cysteine desulfurase [Firmicutes bacterium ADurb.Bin080]
MKVYLDNSATTPLNPYVLEAMLPFYTEKFGNAASIHSFGREANRAVSDAREIIAECINSRPSEIYFTSGGTESDNWALKGAVSVSKNKNKHIITTLIEHPAILNTCAELEKQNVKVTYLKPSKEGIINIKNLSESITEDTILSTIMFANNEIGTIQPIKEAAAICRDFGVLFHTDAVQAMDSQKIDVKDLGVDMLSMSAHKFHGPKGIGVLFLKTGSRLGKLINGGEQERGLRAGTTPTPLIVGMAKALEISNRDREINNERILRLRNRFIDMVLSEIPYAYLNGCRDSRLPNNANFSFAFIEGESILMRLDLAGIAVSSGSACASGSLEASHVILSLGVKEELAHSTIRFSLGVDTTEQQMDYVFNVLKKTVDDLRKMSPLYDYEKGIGSYV